VLTEEEDLVQTLYVYGWPTFRALSLIAETYCRSDTVPNDTEIPTDLKNTDRKIANLKLQLGHLRNFVKTTIVKLSNKIHWSSEGQIQQKRPPIL
jgi:hypothetical protein